MEQISPGERLARDIAARLRSNGFQALLVGGCVRDRLLGLNPADFDLATDALPDDVVRLFPRAERVGAHFGVVLVHERLGDGRGPDRAEVEVATFRSEGDYTDGRRPGAVALHSDPLHDALRRDFTVNALFADPETGEIIDHVGGRVDLDARIIRTVGDPGARFREDHLRMLRAVRFAARLGFTIEPATLSAIREHAASIHRISAERIRDELTRILTEGGARRGFELLNESGLLREVLPEIADLQGVEQPPEFHPEGDVWEHTLRLLDGLAQSSSGAGLGQSVSGAGLGQSMSGDGLGHGLSKSGSHASSTLAWGALLHDVGKPATFTEPTGPADRIRFNGHVAAGERIAERILSRLRFSCDDTARILALIHNHMRFGDVRGMKDSTLKRFLRLDHFGEHLALHRLDCMASHGLLGNYDFARQKFEETPQETLRPPRLVTGSDLLGLGLTPGPRFREILDLIEEAQLSGTLSTRDEALRLVGRLAQN